jgi:hypothetical protein
VIQERNAEIDIGQIDLWQRVVGKEVPIEGVQRYLHTLFEGEMDVLGLTIALLLPGRRGIAGVSTRAHRSRPRR